jgi:hypothetical protein
MKLRQAMKLLNNPKIRTFFELDTPLTVSNIIQLETLILAVLISNKVL